MYKFNAKAVTINGQRTVLYVPKTAEKSALSLSTKRIMSGLAIGLTLLFAAFGAYASI